MNATLENGQPTLRQAGPWRREGRAMLLLAVPLILTELSHMAIVTTDVVMMGWLGPQSLAAGSLAGHLYAFLDYFALSVLTAVSPILAHQLGARRFRLVRRTVRQGFWAALILALPCVVLIWQAEALLLLLGQEPELASAARPYIRIMVLGFLPGLWFMVLSEFLVAHVRPRVLLAVAVLGVGVNGLADYALMFGNLGFPRLGLAGAGVASATVNTFMFLSLLGFVLVDRRLRRYRLLGHFWRADWPRLVEILRLGLPIGVSSVAETGMFLASALLMGLLGTVPLAAHAVAIQCASIAYMVPFGVAQAAAVRVGRAIGAGDHRAADRAGWTALALGVGFAALPAALFWGFGEELTALFLDPTVAENRPVIDLAVAFLAVAAFFQLADAAQAVSAGILRGYKDTRVPMLIAVGGYWGLGLSSAALFGVYLGQGGEAIWIALAVALSLVGILLVWRFRRQSARLAAALG